MNPMQFPPSVATWLPAHHCWTLWSAFVLLNFTCRNDGAFSPVSEEQTFQIPVAVQQPSTSLCKCERWNHISCTSLCREKAAGASGDPEVLLHPCSPTQTTLLLLYPQDKPCHSIGLLQPESVCKRHSQSREPQRYFPHVGVPAAAFLCCML